MPLGGARGRHGWTGRRRRFRHGLGKQDRRSRPPLGEIRPGHVKEGAGVFARVSLGGRCACRLCIGEVETQKPDRPWNPVELFQVEDDPQLGRDHRIDHRVGGCLDLVDRSGPGRIQKRHCDRPGAARREPERDRSELLRQLRRDQAHRFAVNRVEVLLESRRHALLSGQRAGEPVEIDRAEFNEVRTDSPPVQFLLPEGFVSLGRRNQLVVDEDVAESTGHSPPL